MARGRSVIVLIACGLLLAACSATSDVRATPAGSTVVLSCSKAPLREPKLLVLTCRTSGALMAETTWTTWGPSRAVGVGSFGLTPCRPICTVASMDFYSGATIVLEDPRHLADGASAFSRAVISAEIDGHAETYRFALGSSTT